MTDTEARDPQGVRGERSVALVNIARSVQSRVSGALAAALMIALGIAALTWYYAHALTRPTHATAVVSATASRASRHFLQVKMNNAADHAAFSYSSMAHSSTSASSPPPSLCSAPCVSSSSSSDRVRSSTLDNG